jgi:hypothetical protein
MPPNVVRRGWLERTLFWFGVLLMTATVVQLSYCTYGMLTNPSAWEHHELTMLAADIHEKCLCTEEDKKTPAWKTNPCGEKYVFADFYAHTAKIHVYGVIEPSQQKQIEDFVRRTANKYPHLQKITVSFYADRNAFFSLSSATIVNKEHDNAKYHGTR